jgi:hypothetical protein
MAKKTITQQAEALSDEVKEKFSQMARDGNSITDIAEKFKQPYAVVQTCLWQSGTLPWLGAKIIITRRLRSLSTARRQGDRDRLVSEIDEQVDYLYYAARQLAAQMERVKKLLRK